MRNTIMKTTLAVLALSILAACGPSDADIKAKNDAEARAKIAAYYQGMKDADAEAIAKDNANNAKYARPSK